MLVTDHLPKLGPDLVTALASLNVQDFPHFFLEKSELQKLLLFVAVAMNELDESICRGRREGESGDRTVELIIIEREMAGHFCFGLLFYKENQTYIHSPILFLNYANDKPPK